MNTTKANTIAKVLELRKGYRNGILTYPTMKEQLAMSPIDAVSWQAVLILEGKRDILTGSQSKLDKSNASETGFVNRGLTMSPSDEASPFLGKGFNACHGATIACSFACVGAKTGQGRLKSSKVARIGRTIVFDCFREDFRRLLTIEIKIAELKAQKIGAKLAMRLNVATDHWQFAEEIAALFPSIVFYDYSAIPNAVRKQSNVQRIYSLKDGDCRLSKALEILKEGHGVAVVFDIESRSKAPLPATWQGVPVIDGDLNDLWFTRKPANGAFVVGLRVKGNAKQVEIAKASGFAQSAQ